MLCHSSFTDSQVARGPNGWGRATSNLWQVLSGSFESQVFEFGWCLCVFFFKFNSSVEKAFPYGNWSIKSIWIWWGMSADFWFESFLRKLPATFKNQERIALYQFAPGSRNWYKKKENVDTWTFLVRTRRGRWRRRREGEKGAQAGERRWGTK